MRAFVALDLEVALRDEAARIRDRLERSAPATTTKARFEPTERLHLTLKFLGDIDEARAETIADGIEHLATPQAIAWSALDAFPSRSRGRVILLAIEPGTLGPLVEAIEDHALALGIEKEERPYRPHVTLARLAGEPADVTKWLESVSLEPTRGVAAALTVYESAGGKYVPFARMPIPSITSTGSP